MGQGNGSKLKGKPIMKTRISISFALFVALLTGSEAAEHGMN